MQKHKQTNAFTDRLVEEVEVVLVQEIREELPGQPVQVRLDGHVQPPGFCLEGWFGVVG
jgi:hypothetical protein